MKQKQLVNQWYKAHNQPKPADAYINNYHVTSLRVFSKKYFQSTVSYIHLNKHFFKAYRQVAAYLKEQEDYRRTNAFLLLKL